MEQRIMLVGEPMGLFIAQEEGSLEDVKTFSSAVAGAEFNVAVGLSRLGFGVSYLTKLGRDPFGSRIVKTMEQNNIDTSLITYSEDRATGFMLKGKTSHGDPQVHYFRKNSAASSICKEDIDKIDFAGCGILHLTGILPPLSQTTMEAAAYLMRKARKSGLTVFFDPNLRPRLWPDEHTMVETLNELAAQSDYFLPGYKEGDVLIGTSDPQKIAEYYLDLGVKAVIVKVGKKGAYAATRQREFYSPTYHAEKIVDTVGAGDGFAAGVISAYAEGLSLEEAVRRGNAIGTIQVMSEGDNEGLPTKDQLQKFMAETAQEDD